METIVCDISAFQYWRTPPIVRLLAAAPEDNPILQSLVSQDELTSLRLNLSETLPLSKTCSVSSPHWRKAGTRSRNIRDIYALLSVSMAGPVDTLVQSDSERHESSLLRARLWSAELPLGSTAPLSDELSVASPELALHQLAARTTLVRTVLLASELCGSFSIYQAPAPVARILQRLLDSRRLPRLGGWGPCTDRNGNLSNLWSRKPLVTPHELATFAENSESRNGRARLLKASELVVPNAASPFEAQAGVLLGFSRRHGGEGYSGFEHNKQIRLSSEARLLAGKDTCYCDIYFDEGLDVECQSALCHSTESSLLSDSNRSAGLELMGVKVLPVTFEHLTSTRRFTALAHAVANMRGLSYRKKTSSQLEASVNLRREVLVDWKSLPFV